MATEREQLPVGIAALGVSHEAQGVRPRGVTLQVRAQPRFLGVQRAGDGRLLVTQEIDEGFGLHRCRARDLRPALDSAIAPGAVGAADNSTLGR